MSKKGIVRWVKRLVCLGVVAGLLVVIIAPEWVLPGVAEFLDVSETPTPVDYVLVLNGDPETRPFAAAAMVKAGLAREVLLTRQRLTLESSSVQQGEMLSELEIIQRVLRARGVPERAIRVLPGEITSTADEARELAAFMMENPDARVAVVTNSFHTRRARWICRRMLGEDEKRIYLIGVPRDGVDERSWWRTPQGCGVYLSEYPKFLYYRLKY